MPGAGRGGDVDLGINFGLLELDCCIEQEDLCIDDLLGHRGVDAFLVNEYALNDLGVLYRAAGLLLYLDVLDVDLTVIVSYHHDCADNEVTELVLACLCALAGHGGTCDVFQENLVRCLHIKGQVL